MRALRRLCETRTRNEVGVAREVGGGDRDVDGRQRVGADRTASPALLVARNAHERQLVCAADTPNRWASLVCRRSVVGRKLAAVRVPCVVAELEHLDFSVQRGVRSRFELERVAERLRLRLGDP